MRRVVVTVTCAHDVGFAGLANFSSAYWRIVSKSR